MKNKIMLHAFLPAMLGLGLMGAGAASANWFGLFGGSSATPEQIATRQQTIFDQEAQILGVSVDDVKNAWADGKTFQQLAQEKGITQEQLQTKMKDLRTQQIKSQLQTLVGKGVITQDQMNKRLQFIQTQQSKSNGTMNRRFFRGLGF